MILKLIIYFKIFFKSLIFINFIFISSSTSSQQSLRLPLIIYGSSTMWHLSNEMEDLTVRKNIYLKNHSISGDNLGGSGQAQGSNIVTLRFPSGVVSATSIITPTIASSFGSMARHNRVVELSNGLKGTLYANGTFKASNLTTNLTVSKTKKFRVFEYPRYNLIKGVYVFNIGKNDVSGTEDNSQWIFDNTVKMIEYIPKGSKFIVGGHFSNTNSNAMHRQVVNSVNSKLRLKYGVKYFDISDLLYSDATWNELGLAKTADDLTAISNGWLPPSLSRDNAHLSAGMDIILARRIENKLTSLGYI